MTGTAVTASAGGADLIQVPVNATVTLTANDPVIVGVTHHDVNARRVDESPDH